MNRFRSALSSRVTLAASFGELTRNSRSVIRSIEGEDERKGSRDTGRLSTLLSLSPQFTIALTSFNAVFYSSSLYTFRSTIKFQSPFFTHLSWNSLISSVIFGNLISPRHSYENGSQSKSK